MIFVSVCFLSLSLNIGMNMPVIRIESEIYMQDIPSVNWPYSPEPKTRETQSLDRGSTHAPQTLDLHKHNLSIFQNGKMAINTSQEQVHRENILFRLTGTNVLFEVKANREYPRTAMMNWTEYPATSFWLFRDFTLRVSIPTIIYYWDSTPRSQFIISFFKKKNIHSLSSKPSFGHTYLALPPSLIPSPNSCTKICRRQRTRVHYTAS